jgi:6-pyruvoyl-tetrahydropterin synthase
MRLFVDNLTNIDFSYLCPKRGLVGETWLANVELAGELDEQGMICDFGIVKKILRNWLEHRIDHCLLVPANSPEVKTDTQGFQHRSLCTD